jgi:hypothetical protein
LVDFGLFSALGDLLANPARQNVVLDHDSILLKLLMRAFNSAVEYVLHTDGVAGSNPATPIPALADWSSFLGKQLQIVLVFATPTSL